MSLSYLSVCSGIEAASVAWEPLGFKPIAFSEIEPFPCEVLQHHYPHIPNLGDMTAIDGAAFRGKTDILVGGTPCQAFSYAGLRQGLADDRGNLSLKFVELADAVWPSFTVWENVTGVFSSKDNAFGCFLAGLAGEDIPFQPPGGKRTLGRRRASRLCAWFQKNSGVADLLCPIFLAGTTARACVRCGVSCRRGRSHPSII